MKNLKFSEEEFTRDGFETCEVTWKGGTHIRDSIQPGQES